MNRSNHEKADDSSTVFDADTVMPDEVPSSSPPMPPLPALATTATTTDDLYNNNESISSTSIQEESPANTISEFLRRINSRHRPATITTRATATATRSEEIEISTNESSSSSSSKKRPIITNSSSNSSRKKTRRSSRLKKRQPDQICTDDKSDSEVEDENELDDDEPDEEISTNQSSSSQTSATKKLTKYELKWKSKFEELCAFKQLHRHTNVPRSNKQLNNWVNTQRSEYRNFKANKKSQITKERIQTLESIGFEWVSPNKGGFQRKESAWNKRFNELKAYKEKYGHTNVPQDFKDNKQLGQWVKNQRLEYKKFNDNKKAKITPERIEMLESIDFEWVAQYDESLWNKRFTELKEYKEKYGRTHVSRSENRQLGEWVSKQRTQYKKFQENKKSQITPERIEMLNSIRFQWECRPGRAPRS